MKSNRKKLKGMTLVEVIVALAVFTIMAAMMVMVCVSISKTVTHTNRFTRKINYQAPAAENRYEDSDMVETQVDIENINLSGNGAYKQLKVKLYEVQKEVETDASGNIVYEDNTSGNFKYFVYEEVEDIVTTT